MHLLQLEAPHYAVYLLESTNISSFMHNRHFFAQKNK